MNYESLRGTRTVAEMASIVGVTPDTWASYERGERIPRDEVKVKIALQFWDRLLRTGDSSTVFSQIPMEVITTGRDLGEVLTAYMTFHKRAIVVAAEAGKPEDETFADAMQAAVYRLYLLGVEDGMKRG